MPKAISTCPDCGEPVTPFAAGCAICGADIAAARAALAQSRRHATRPDLHRVQLGDDSLRFLIALVVVVAAPFFGVLLACYFAWQLHNEGRIAWRNAMLVLALIAVATMTAGGSLWLIWRR